MAGQNLLKNSASLFTIIFIFCSVFLNSCAIIKNKIRGKEDEEQRCPGHTPPEDPFPKKEDGKKRQGGRQGRNGPLDSEEQPGCQQDRPSGLKNGEDPSPFVGKVGLVERFNPAIVEMEPHLNRPVFLESHRMNQFTTRGTDVDVVLDLMIHDLDLIQRLVGDPTPATSPPIITSRVSAAWCEPEDRSAPPPGVLLAPT